MIKEIRNIKGYYISDNGIIYNSNHEKQRTFINPCGHPTIKLNNRYYTIAYLVANTFIPNDKYMCVGFTDKNKRNTNLNNLYWFYEGELEEYERYKATEVVNIKLTPQGKRKVYTTDIDGNILGEFNSIAELAKLYNINTATAQAQANYRRFNKKNGFYIIDISEYNNVNFEALKNKGTNNRTQGNLKPVYIVNEQADIIKEYPTIKLVIEEMKLTYNSILPKLNRHRILPIGDNYLIRKDDYTPTSAMEIINRFNEKHNKEKKHISLINRVILKINFNGDVIARYRDNEEAINKLNIDEGTLNNYLYYYKIQDDEKYILVREKQLQKRGLNEILTKTIGKKRLRRLRLQGKIKSEINFK